MRGFNGNDNTSNNSLRTVTKFHADVYYSGVVGSVMTGMYKDNEVLIVLNDSNFITITDVIDGESVCLTRKQWQAIIDMTTRSYMIKDEISEQQEY